MRIGPVIVAAGCLGSSQASSEAAGARTASPAGTPEEISVSDQGYRFQHTEAGGVAEVPTVRIEAGTYTATWTVGGG